MLVGTTDETVFLASEIGPSPNEFMTAETFRGQVLRDPSPDPSLPWRATLAGWAGTALRGAVLGMTELPAMDRAGGVTLEAGARSLAASIDAGLQVLRTAKQPQTLALRMWRSDPSQRWEAIATAEAARFVAQTTVSGDFLKLRIDTRKELLCLGLLDRQGFGPIVNIPPFAEPVEITFLSKGVLVEAADRMATPGGQRIPVALVTPTQYAAADFLAALAAPAIAGAAAVWQQNSGALDPNDGSTALELFSQKFERPAEAVLAAHYLLRFLPQKLPLGWVDNLKRVLPAVADGPVISAWARVLNRPRGMTDDEVDRAVEENISLALSRPITLFARTRALLADSRHLVSKDLASATAWKQESEYRRFGAESGGLESFWGIGPSKPGKSGGATSSFDVMRVGLVAGVFASTGDSQHLFQQAH